MGHFSASEHGELVYDEAEEDAAEFLKSEAKRGRAIAMLLVERFFGTLGSRDKAMIAETSVHAAAALQNCQHLSSVPFLSILSGLRWPSGR